MREIADDNRDYARGAYIAWYLDRSSSRAVHDWCRRMGVAKPVAVGEHHCTIMYSPEVGMDPVMHGDHPLPMPWTEGYPVPMNGVGMPRQTDVLGPMDGRGALVVLLDVPAIRQRHRWWRDEHRLVHNFPDIRPHVTLSYDFSAQDPGRMLDAVRSPLGVPLRFDVERRDFCNK